MKKIVYKLVRLSEYTVELKETTKTILLKLIGNELVTITLETTSTEALTFTTPPQEDNISKPPPFFNSRFNRWVSIEKPKQQTLNLRQQFKIQRFFHQQQQNKTSKINRSSLKWSTLHRYLTIWRLSLPHNRFPLLLSTRIQP